MKNKSFVISRTATAFLAGSCVFIGFAAYFFKIVQRTWGWVSIACAAFFLLSVFAVPLFYVVDKNGIRIRYITGDKENYEWKNVRGVVAEYDLTIPFIFDTFRIDGDDYTFYMFYKEGRMERSRALARAIEKHSGKAVEGMLPDGLSAGAARRFKLSYGKAPDAEAAQAAERNVRKAVRDTLSALGLKSVGVNYTYVTKDGETEKRPAVSYTYSAKLTKDGSEVGTVKLLDVKRKGKKLAVGFEADTAYLENELKPLA